MEYGSPILYKRVEIPPEFCVTGEEGIFGWAISKEKGGRIFWCTGRLTIGRECVSGISSYCATIQCETDGLSQASGASYLLHCW